MYERVSRQPQWAPLVQYFSFLHNFSAADFAKAEECLRKSIAGAPSVNSEGCIVMLHLTWKGDLDGADRDIAAIPPTMLNDARVVLFVAKTQMAERRPEEALATLDRLPDDFIHDSWFIGAKDELVGIAHRLAGRLEAARIAWESGLAVVDARLKAAPNDPDLHLARGVLLGWLGRESEALAEAKTVDELYRHSSMEWDRSKVKIFAALGRADLAMPLLKSLYGLVGKTSATSFVVWPLTNALLRLDPQWDKLRDNPEFKALVANEPKKNAG